MRGCDEEFAEAWDYFSRNPGQLKRNIDEFLLAQKQREERTNANAEKFLEEFGIKYCPFHYSGLVEDVETNFISLNVGGINYQFNNAVCASWKLCKTPINFDNGLIKEISKMNLKKVKTSRSNNCTTCGESGGLAYFIGFRKPKHHAFSNIHMKREYSNDIPIYFFDRSGSCGHSYVFMQSSGAFDLELKDNKKCRMIKGKLFILD